MVTKIPHRCTVRLPKDNILYGRPDASDEEVKTKQPNRHMLMSLPKRHRPVWQHCHDAQVGERGVKLWSTSTCCYLTRTSKNAPLLVLDEATSALDSEVEAAIQESLIELMKRKTVIAIAATVYRPLLQWTARSYSTKAISLKKARTKSC